MDGEGGVVDRRQAGGETGPPRVMAVLVPPAILQEVEAVFQSPVAADVPQQVRRGDLLGVEAGDEVSHIARQHFAVRRAQLTIHADR